MIEAQVIQYIIESREENIKQMSNAQCYENFYYYKGKVYAYNEMLRILLDDE